MAYTSFDTEVITNTVTAIDPDSNNLTQLIISIGGYQNGFDTLSFTNTRYITGFFDSANGLLRLSGTAYIGDYREALRTATFSSAATSGSRVLSKIATDDGGPTSADSTPSTRTISH